MPGDVSITLYNQTGDDQYLMVFEQDPSINGLFSAVFPTAWRVFKTGGTGGQGSVVLPVQNQIGAGDTYDVFSGSVSSIRNTDVGKKWEFTINGAGFFQLNPVGNQADGSMACLNATGQYVTVSLAKSNKPLLTYPKVGNGATGTFMPIGYIYIAWVNSVAQGSQISAAISQPQALGVNLDGAQAIEGKLTKNPGNGQLNWAVKINGLAVAPSPNTSGLKPPNSFTQSYAEARLALQRRQ